MACTILATVLAGICKKIVQSIFRKWFCCISSKYTKAINKNPEGITRQGFVETLFYCVDKFMVAEPAEAKLVIFNSSMTEIN